MIPICSPAAYERTTDFSQPLDDCWEVVPDKHWSFETSPGNARFESRSGGRAEIYLRPCAMPGDTVEIRLLPGAPRAGLFTFGFLTGFEHVRVELDLGRGELTVHTHEFHKPQPRLATKTEAAFDRVRLVWESDCLPQLPFKGSRISVILDDQCAAVVEQIDFLPESHCMFGFNGPGEVAIASWSISGPPRPRPEYMHVGIWQHTKPCTRDSVDSLINGVRKGAEAGVDILVTAETSLTGLRFEDPELDDRDLIKSELKRFQQAVAQTRGAPYTLIGYPAWIPGDQVEGATCDFVKINRHLFVRPDGSLGPPMAKVHSCEEGMWHGRHYNLQRVCGVEVAIGVCHDIKYRDVWCTGVMAGARLCLHPAAGGTPAGTIDEIRQRNTEVHSPEMDAFWVHVNDGGGSAIYYPRTTARLQERIVAATKDLTKHNPSFPDYASMGDQFAAARIRLYDATGCFPMRTLRAGSKAYECWSRLIPDIVDVDEDVPE